MIVLNTPELPRRLQLLRIQLILVVICFSGASCGDQNTTRAQKKDDTTQRNGTNTVEYKAVDDAINCLNQTQTADNTEAQLAAIKLIADKHAIEGVPILTKKIRTVVDPIIADWNDARMFPAHLALVQIGDPAVGELCRRFEHSSVYGPEGREQRLLLETLVEIKGRGWAIHYLESLQKLAKFPGSSEDYNSSLVYVDTF